MNVLIGKGSFGEVFRRGRRAVKQEDAKGETKMLAIEYRYEK